MSNVMTLSYTSVDTRKSGEAYLYIPAMRRVLRVEVSQRPAPLAGSIQSLDDLSGWNAHIPGFTYTLVGEAKVLVSMDTSSLSAAAANARPAANDVRFCYDNWQVKDVYVVEAKAKDPKYPQSKDRVHIDKVNYAPNYWIAFDKAGKPWKIWNPGQRPFSQPDGTRFNMVSSVLVSDLQYGIVESSCPDFKFNTMGLAYIDASPASLNSRAW
jgi:hypothetical protein